MKKILLLEFVKIEILSVFKHLIINANYVPKVIILMEKITVSHYLLDVELLNMLQEIAYSVILNIELVKENVRKKSKSKIANKLILQIMKNV